MDTAFKQSPVGFPGEVPGQRVLVVEDDPLSQKLMKIALNRIGFQATIASSGEEALHKLRHNSYAIILMDCLLPGLDGYSTTRAIRQLDAPKRHTPIIGVTAYSFCEDREKCLASGMNDYLSKPIRLDQMETVVKAWLADRR